jgi:hypothetical protein
MNLEVLAIFIVFPERKVVASWHYHASVFRSITIFKLSEHPWVTFIVKLAPSSFF